MINNDHLATRIVLRPIGAPLPLGMSGLAIASLVASGLQLHWVAQSQAMEVGLILVSVPFALQLIACVLSYLARDGAAGAALGVLATSWLALGLIHISAPRSVTSSATGLLLLAAGGSLVLSAMAVARAKPLPALIFIAAGLRFVLAGIYHVSAATAWGHASGLLGLVICGLAGYCILAFELESQPRGSVLPTLRLDKSTSPVNNRGTEQVPHEPGVRQST